MLELETNIIPPRQIYLEIRRLCNSPRFERTNQETDNRDIKNISKFSILVLASIAMEYSWAFGKIQEAYNIFYDEINLIGSHFR